MTYAGISALPGSRDLRQVKVAGFTGPIQKFDPVLRALC